MIDSLVLEDFDKGKKFAGMIYVGTNPLEEMNLAKRLVNVLFVVPDPEQLKQFFNDSKFEPILSRYANEALSNRDNETLVLNVMNDKKYSSFLDPTRLLEKNQNLKILKRVPLTSKRFETFYRDNNSDLNLSKYDVIRLNVNGFEKQTLEGFGKLLNIFPFRMIIARFGLEPNYKDESSLEDVEEYLNSLGFSNNTTFYTSEYKEVVFLRGV